MAQRPRRWSDAALYELQQEFKDHRVQEHEWKEVIQGLQNEIHTLRNEMTIIKDQIPIISQGITRWSQAKAIFFVVGVFALAITGLIDIVGWLTSHVREGLT